ncbi:DNA cytosine methyltransferase [Rhodanobacter sp. 115]|uniref:DNA cytosine methyltransferase n=1 Tax=Rhodanobacter sp. FW021-MT20 TaxID=1162282 RepID=UPI0034E5B76F
MLDYEVGEVKVGSAHGAPRVWMEGMKLARAGFMPGTKYAIEVAGVRVVLRIAESGERSVSLKRRGEAELPVIDLNSAKALGVFDGLERIRVIVRANEITLLPLATQVKARERLARITNKMRRGEPLTVGSLCHGGGTTSFAVETGMAEAGVPTRLAFAADIDPDVLHHAQANNPVWRTDTAAIAAPMQEMVADNWLLSSLGRMDILEAGIPCVAASLAGRAKKGLDMAEADPNAGHLVVAFLGLVEAFQPAVVVVENVPPYQNTASAHLIRNTLRDWGYTISEAVLDAQDFGSIEARKRLALVATTAGLAFDFETVRPSLAGGQHTLGDVLEDVPVDDPSWRAMDYLREKELRDKEAGKGFRMQIADASSTKIGTVGAAYSKCRSTEVKVRHPIEGDALLRLLTPREHARIKGVPESMIAGLPATRAHHLLGNGVSVQTFKALGRALGAMLALLRQQPQLALAAA